MKNPLFTITVMKVNCKQAVLHLFLGSYSAKRLNLIGMHTRLLLFFILLCRLSFCQPVNLSLFNVNGQGRVTVRNKVLTVRWPAGKNRQGRLILNLEKARPLFESMELTDNGVSKKIASNLDPAFILTTGKRDLVSQNGWNIFFDKVPLKPHQSFLVEADKRSASVISAGSRTIIKIPGLHAGTFKGVLEITLYNGSALINVAAVMSTQQDSTAILYDAGFVAKSKRWKKIAWADTDNKLRFTQTQHNDSSRNIAVKYRAVIGQTKQGCVAVFPPPHQYFYPLDEAFNLKFCWYGSNYRRMMPGFGIGIRQDLYGDNRYVPWFNAPPKTQQRLNFFCLLSTNQAPKTLEQVKQFTHGDSYVRLKGYKTMCSHFHNEFTMKVVLAGKPVPATPNFVKVFKATGVDIVHLAEFHFTAHPQGPDKQRLTELKALFDECRRVSNKKFLLLPGEEPDEFFGGHWVSLFPRPVYWIMSRNPNMPFVTQLPGYGKVYRVANKNEMLRLLTDEKGLAWTAHARTKASTGFPERYKDEAFFRSNRFMGAAWKALPGDLSQFRLGKRILDLINEMNNWGVKKHVLAEADLFSVEPRNEMYGHLNVNYLQLHQLPEFSKGWEPVLTTLEHGKFFSTTGEVLLPSFSVNGKGAGETIHLNKEGKARVRLSVNWTFPLNFVEIISGDGKRVYQKRIDLSYTKAFGKRDFLFPINLKNKTWVRVEVWDVAANGAFTQTVWIK